MKLILGDNAISGVNHANLKKATDAFKKYGEIDAVVEYLHLLQSLGVESFSYTTTDKMNVALKKFIIQGGKLKLYPALPYAHTYASLLGEVGPTGMLRSLVPANFGSLVSILRMIRGDITGLLRLLISREIPTELRPNVKTVFLNNIFTDSLLASRRSQYLDQFSQSVADLLPDSSTGFMTMNHVRLEKQLDLNGNSATICSIINRLGFRMNPDQGQVETCLRRPSSRPVYAMSILASGEIDFKDAIGYVGQFERIKAVLISSSNEFRIREMRENIANA